MNSFDITPEYYLNHELDHFSPSQDTKPIDFWFWMYVVKNSEFRRKRKANPNMIGGTAAEGNTTQTFIHPATDQEVIIPPFSLGSYLFNGYTKEKAIETAIEYCQEKKLLFTGDDLEHFEKIIDILPIVLLNSFKAVDELKLLDEELQAQKLCSYKHPGIDVHTIGYVDIATPTRFIEYKTKWMSKGKRGKKDQLLYRKNNIPTEKTGPDYNHILQVAHYWKATNLEPIILYVSGHKENDYIIFTPDNCDKLKPESLENFIEHSRRTQMVRQNILQQSNNIKDLAKFIQPDFSSFYWRDFNSEEMQEVNKLWQ